MSLKDISFWEWLFIVFVFSIFVILNTELYSVIKVYQKGTLEYSRVIKKEKGEITLYKASRAEVYRLDCENKESALVSESEFEKIIEKKDSIPFFKYQTFSGENRYFYTGKSYKVVRDFFDNTFILYLLLYAIGLVIYFIYIFGLYKKYFSMVSLIYHEKTKDDEITDSTIKFIKKLIFYLKQATPALIGVFISILIFYIVGYKIYYAEYSKIWIMMIYLLSTFFIVNILPYYLLLGVKRFRQGNSRTIWVTRLVIACFVVGNIIFSFYQLTSTGDINNITFMKFGKYLYNNIFDLLG